MANSQTIAGGCQCGTVRYEADVPPNHASYCHCRMCQKALGTVVATFANFPRDRLRFVRGRPKYFRSSGFAKRGFCPDCGTPLTFEYDAFPENVSVTVGSLDDPALAPPSKHWGVESQVPWFRIVDDLPRTRTEDDPDFHKAKRGEPG